MANNAKCDEVMQAIADNQDRWYQGSYASGEANIDATNHHECGTTLCAAGWAGVLNGWLPSVSRVFGYWEPIDWFVPVGAVRDRNAENYDPSRSREAFSLARDILELTESEAYLLFVRSEHITDIDQMRKLFDIIKNGQVDNHDLVDSVLWPENNNDD